MYRTYHPWSTHDRPSVRGTDIYALYTEQYVIVVKYSPYLQRLSNIAAHVEQAFMFGLM